ncbi:MAG: TonB-dependent receptor plug domain-containing protein [Gammaproteobacteria bacterium]
MNKSWILVRPPRREVAESRDRRVLAALASSLVAMAELCVPAQRALGAEQAESAREFAIPSQALSAALRQFAEVSGLQLVYSPQLVSGLKSGALSGRMTSGAALKQLLTNTGIVFRFANETTVTLEKAPDRSGARTLGPVRVEGASAAEARLSGSNGSSDRTATEGTGSYTSDALSIGSKAPLSMKGTPQSVSVLTQQRMQDQNITDFKDAMNQMPGITMIQGDNSLQNYFYSRGFQIASVQVDGGAPLFVGHITGASGIQMISPQIDMSEYDHVEFLRGADGLFNFYGDPSGSVNLVRKRPLDHSQVTWEAQGGSWNNYRTTMDATRPLAFDGALRGRLVLTYQSNDYFYDIAKDRRQHDDGR